MTAKHAVGSCFVVAGFRLHFLARMLLGCGGVSSGVTSRGDLTELTKLSSNSISVTLDAMSLGQSFQQTSVR